MSNLSTASILFLALSCHYLSGIALAFVVGTRASFPHSSLRGHSCMRGAAAVGVRCSSRGDSSLACSSGDCNSSVSVGNGGSGASPTGGFGSRAARRRRTQARRGGPRKNKPDASPVIVLKRSTRWACVKNCGACCYLAVDDRPELEEFLDADEVALHESMKLEDGWCMHYDKENRACRIYEDRPRFCRVEAETFGEMYGVEPEDMDDFCSSCCKDQIADVHGAKSKELKVFESALAALARGERPLPSDPFEDAGPGGSQGQWGVASASAQIRDWGVVSTEGTTEIDGGD